jgi:hypothetical protein
MNSSDNTAETGEASINFETHSTRFDHGQFERPTTAVAEAVAAATDREPTGLPPLYEVIDSDALDALFSRERMDDGRNVSVSFEYAGVEVVVSADGVEVRPITVDDNALD